MEQFKQIQESEIYSISTEGRLRNNQTGKILKPYKQSSGYLSYHILGRHLYAHRLVAIAFIPIPGNKGSYEVDHKDHDKTNNTVANLQWITHSQNVKRSFDTGIRQGYWRGKRRSKFTDEHKEKMSEAHKQPISIYKDNVLIYRSTSIQDAANYLGITRTYLYIIVNKKGCLYKNFLIKK